MDSENETEIYKQGDRVKIETAQGTNITGEISCISINDKFEHESRIWLNNCVYVEIFDIKSIKRVSFNNK